MIRRDGFRENAHLDRLPASSRAVQDEVDLPFRFTHGNREKRLIVGRRPVLREFTERPVVNSIIQVAGQKCRGMSMFRCDRVNRLSRLEAFLVIAAMVEMGREQNERLCHVRNRDGHLNDSPLFTIIAIRQTMVLMARDRKS